MQAHIDSPSVRSELGMREVVAILWRQQRMIAIVTATVTVLAALAAVVLPKKYLASIVLSPVTTNAEGGALGGLGSLASQFGGIAALAGISIDADARKNESVAVLQSETLTEKYIHDQGLLPVLFRRKWDAQAERWKPKDPGDIPTLWKGSAYFKKNVRKVTTDPKTGLVTLEVTWKDPKLAAQWANGLVAMTNAYLRDKAIAESERNIAYLTAEATKTDVVGVREAIYAILQNEINKAMLARGSEEYALKVLDPAVAPEKHAWPKLPIWAAAGFFGALLLAIGAALARALWSAAKNEA